MTEFVRSCRVQDLASTYVVPSSVKLGVLEFTEVGAGSELDRS